MIRSRHGTAIWRTLSVLCAVILLLTGVTFAAMQSQDATLQGNSITSASASLVIGDANGGYASAASGFSFENLEPGGQPMPSPGFDLKLRNNGSSNLMLQMSINPGNFANANHANIDRIYITLTPKNGGPTLQYSLQSLLVAHTNNTPESLDIMLPAGQTGQYVLQVQMAADSVTDTSAGVALSGIDLVFSGKTVV